MSGNRSWDISRATLLGIMILVLAVASGAGAQSKYKSLYTFTGGADGRFPVAGLVFDSAGNLYGTTEFGGLVSSCSGNGCGVVFELSPKQGGGWSQRVLYSFTGGADGGNPVGDLIFDQAGNLYGTTQVGGPGIGGTVFKLTHNSNGIWTESLVYGFCQGDKSCRDGKQPSAGLVFDSSGNLYGTTYYGGDSSCTPSGCGLVFELTPNSDGSWTENVIHYFSGPREPGADANLIFDAAGNLYSTTNSGNFSYGTVFELIPNADGSWKHKLLHSFDDVRGRSGGDPTSPVVFDQAGNLYSTAGGGDKGDCGGGHCGIVFELTPNANGTWDEKVIHDFTGNDGTWSLGGLIFDQAGNLYGTAFAGGNVSDCAAGGAPYGCGVVFKLEPNTNGVWHETILHIFTDQAGDSHPYDSVIFDSAGNLYGTTSGNQATDTKGSVFEITP